MVKGYQRLVISYRTPMSESDVRNFISPKNDGLKEQHLKLNITPYLIKTVSYSVGISIIKS